MCLDNFWKTHISVRVKRLSVVIAPWCNVTARCNTHIVFCSCSQGNQTGITLVSLAGENVWNILFISSSLRFFFFCFFSLQPKRSSSAIVCLSHYQPCPSASFPDLTKDNERLQLLWRWGNAIIAEMWLTSPHVSSLPSRWQNPQISSLTFTLLQIGVSVFAFIMCWSAAAGAAMKAEEGCFAMMHQYWNRKEWLLNS